MQGLFSHLNVDIKAGPLNYLLIGTELHRRHHSANLQEAGNFGALTPFWDMVFGSFSYSGSQLPERLGTAGDELYPSSNEYLACLALPFSVSNPSEPAIKEP